ncbi:MAG: DUF2179 domain-containing protein, partial [Clostridia bacterium]|nr:DUF2179 domain-containing protein [Clostridia bacterium]
VEGTGLVSGRKEILYCVVTRIEIPEVKRIVKSSDQSAFVTISDVSEIIGNHIKRTNTEVISKMESKEFAEAAK